MITKPNLKKIIFVYASCTGDQIKSVNVALVLVHVLHGGGYSRLFSTELVAATTASKDKSDLSLAANGLFGCMCGLW